MAAHWQECHLGDIITLQRGFDLPNRERREGTVPIVSSSGISGYHNIAKVKGPGVVTGRYGTLGEVFFVSKDFWPLNTTLYVKDFKSNDPLFISYLLKTLDFAHHNAAGAVPGVNRNALHLLTIQVPDIPTQRRIATVLSAYDDLIENNQRRIAILEEMARNLYREWFVHLRFPGHEGVEIVERDGMRVPEGWEVVRATDAIEINPKTKVPREGTKPFLPMGSLSERSMLIGDVEYREGNSGSKFKNGDTLFARITPCLENGKTGFVQFLPSDDAVAFGSTEFIVLRSRTLCPEIVYLIARSDEFRDNAIKSMSGATGRQRVQEKCFDMFLFIHPDKRTIKLFREHIAPIFKSIQLLAEKNTFLRRTRDLLLPKLISGELDVSELEITGAEELIAA